MDNAWFGEVRALLHGASSQGAWEALCGLWSAPQAVQHTAQWLPYAASMLEPWPWALRVAPQAWGEAALRGEVLASWSLVRDWAAPASGLDAAMIAQLGAWGAFAPLRSLKIGGLEDESLRVLLEVSGGELVSLQVHHHALTARGARLLVEHPIASRLERLALTQGPLGSQALVSLWCARWGALRALRLDHNPLSQGPRVGALTGAPMSSLFGGVIAPCLAASTLEEVGLTGGDLSYEAVDALLGDGHERLSRLDLGSNQLFDEGVRRLVRCRLPALRRLDLSYNGITHMGASALAEAPWVSGLEELTLDGNALGDAGYTALVQSPHLGELLRRRLLARWRDG